MNLENLGLVELNAQEVQLTDGGMIHPEGYSNGIMAHSGSQAHFWGGFISGLYHSIFG
jgi:hypothetical protein